MLRKSLFASSVTLLFGALLSAIVSNSVQADEPAEKPARVTQVRGVDMGGKQPTVYVARDKATWNKIKQAAGERHEFPRSAVQDPSIKVPSLDDLDGTDFQQDMIVAVFWGEMNFSGHEEKCWIEAVNIGERQVTVDCRANLWGGNVLRSYRAWPYDARVVHRSDLPVVFVQATEYKADPKLSEKNKVLATLKSDDWQREVERTE